MLEPLVVSIPEAARLIGCGRTKMYALIGDGALPLLKLGRRSLIPVQALRTFVEARTKEAA